MSLRQRGRTTANRSAGAVRASAAGRQRRPRRPRKAKDSAGKPDSADGPDRPARSAATQWVPEWARAHTSLFFFVLVVNFALAMLLPEIMQLPESVRGFLVAHSGILALVGLTATVVLGLVASYRAVLAPQLRVLLQRGHRAAATLSLACLASHILQKTTSGLVHPLHAVIPFDSPSLAVGCGVVASDLMIVAMLTGVFRARFAHAARPWLWRLLHAAAYAAWGVALFHGLTAGRKPTDPVVAIYLACFAVVCFALLARLTFKVPQRLREPRRAVTVRTAVAAANAKSAPGSQSRAAAREATPQARANPQRMKKSVDEEPEFWSSTRRGGRR